MLSCIMLIEKDEEIISMDSDKLQEIGSKLDVSGQDIKGIRKSHTLSKLKYYIATAIVGILTFIIGFFAGRGSCPEISSASIISPGGYPYAAGLFVPAAMSGKKRTTKIAMILLTMAGFFVALKIAPVFSQAIKYGVYRKRIL